MTVELYLLPVVTIPLNVGSYRVPKYLPHRLNPAEPGLEGVSWAWVSYKFEDVALLIADVTPTQDNQLAGYSDVFAVPPLDNTINNTNQRDIVRVALEDTFIPGNWVQVGMSYREIVRVILHIFIYFGFATASYGGRLFGGDLNLDLTVADIPQAKRDALQLSADHFGLDYSGVTGSTTIRVLLKSMADQFADEPYRMAGAGIELMV